MLYDRWDPHWFRYFNNMLECSSIWPSMWDAQVASMTPSLRNVHFYIVELWHVSNGLEQEPAYTVAPPGLYVTHHVSVWCECSIPGEIPDLFPDDEVENIIGSVRNEVRGLGMMDTRENCWKFFIDRVRKQLKVTNCLAQGRFLLWASSLNFIPLSGVRSWETWIIIIQMKLV